jgi:hypothetical protein
VAALDTDATTRMGRPSQTLDVADVLSFNRGLPSESDTHLAAETLVLDRLIAEHACQNVVPGHRR